jgi:hypothetical protein
MKDSPVLPHSRCIWPHRRRWAFRCYMRADDFAAKFLKVTEGGTYLHRECGRADSPLAKYFMVAALTNLDRQDEARNLANLIGSGEMDFGGDAAARDLRSFGFPESLASAVGDRISMLIGQRDVSEIAFDKKAEHPRLARSD